MDKYVNATELEKLITERLNEPDASKAFGYDAVEILGMIYVMETADVVPAKEYEALLDKYTHLKGSSGLVGMIKQSEAGNLKRGHWIPAVEDADEHGYRCSECGKWSYTIKSYCDCGADMRGKPVPKDKPDSQPIAYGKWVEVLNCQPYTSTYQCSKCGGIVKVTSFNSEVVVKEHHPQCPYCHADMRGDINVKK